MFMPNLHARAQQQTETRLGLAAVELACTLPVLVFCAMITVDFARVVYAQVALQNCAERRSVRVIHSGRFAVAIRMDEPGVGGECGRTLWDDRHRLSDSAQYQPELRHRDGDDDILPDYPAIAAPLDHPDTVGHDALSHRGQCRSLSLKD